MDTLIKKRPGKELEKKEHEIIPMSFTWKIENFSHQIMKEELYSDVFVAGGFNWRVLIYPKGDNVEHLSILLEASVSTTLPPNWNRYADFCFAVVNQKDPKLTIRKDTGHTFDQTQKYWGFKTFMPLTDLEDLQKGYIVDDICYVEVDVAASKAINSSDTCIKVAWDPHIKAQISKDTPFDLVDLENVWSFSIPNKWPFYKFKGKVESECSVPVLCQRFWLWAKRKNHTYRPYRYLSPQEEKLSVGEFLRENEVSYGVDELILYLEVSLGQDSPPRTIETGEILLFFKFYDPRKGVSRFVGSLFVKRWGQMKYIRKTLRELAEVKNRKAAIDLYEEVSFEPNVVCDKLDIDKTFVHAEIEDGDIIWFQESRKPRNCLHPPDVPSFLTHVKNRQIGSVPDNADPSSNLPESKKSDLHKVASTDAECKDNGETNDDSDEEDDDDSDEDDAAFSSGEDDDDDEEDGTDSDSDDDDDEDSDEDDDDDDEEDEDNQPPCEKNN